MGRSGVCQHEADDVAVDEPVGVTLRTLDAEGCLWPAVWGSGELRRCTPAGVLHTVVRLPARQVTSAAFGGTGLATLYITCASKGLTPAERAEQPHAGDIFACTPGGPGRPPYLFAR